MPGSFPFFWVLSQFHRSMVQRRVVSPLLGAAVLLAAIGVVAGVGKYDPCATPGLATINNGMYIGVAFWPGGTVDDWGLVTDSETTITPLDPCNKTNNYNNTGESSRSYLEAQGVVFAAFELKVDTLMSLRLNWTDLLPLYKSVAEDQPDILSVVVFRAGFRSEPRYVISEDATLTKGIGAVTSLAGIVVFSKGSLSYLQWNDQTCNKCGGNVNKLCVQATTGTDKQHSCATALDTCGTVVANATVDCSLQLYVGFNGDDKNSVTFNSGWMIARINQFSVATLYNNALQALTGAFASNANAFITNTNVNAQTTTSGDSGAA